MSCSEALSCRVPGHNNVEGIQRANQLARPKTKIYRLEEADSTKSPIKLLKDTIPRRGSSERWSEWNDRFHSRLPRPRIDEEKIEGE